MQCTVFHIESHDTDTFAILHDQVESEELDEEVGVVTERLTVKCMEEGMASTVSCSGTAVRLSTFSVFERLAAKSTLVDFSLVSSRERNTKVLQLNRQFAQDNTQG